MLYAKTKRIASLLCVLLLTLACFGCSAPAGSAGKGQIYLYGEAHSVPEINQKEFEIWDYYYHEEGMRHLFVEYPYFMAEYLNQWMQAEDDAILDQIFQDIEGTQGHSQTTLDFLHSIKENCPETVFHGFDVGHQYNTTGARYLIGLALTGQMGSADWDETQRVIDQGKQYYQTGDNAYRENAMTENLTRAFEALPMGASVMVITGSAHSNLYAMDYYTGAVPCMANQLRQQYGAALVARNLSAGIDYTRAGETTPVALGGAEYTAVCLGEQDLTAFSDQYLSRTYWLIPDSYAAAAALPADGTVLPHTEYISPVETGQVYRLDYLCADGSTVQWFYRADGALWQDIPVTTGFAA